MTWCALRVEDSGSAREDAARKPRPQAVQLIAVMARTNMLLGDDGGGSHSPARGSAWRKIALADLALDGNKLLIGVVAFRAVAKFSTDSQKYLPILHIILIDIQRLMIVDESFHE